MDVSSMAAAMELLGAAPKAPHKAMPQIWKASSGAIAWTQISFLSACHRDGLCAGCPNSQDKTPLVKRQTLIVVRPQQSDRAWKQCCCKVSTATSRHGKFQVQCCHT